MTSHTANSDVISRAEGIDEEWSSIAASWLDPTAANGVKNSVNTTSTKASVEMATSAPVVIGTNDNTTVTTPPVDPTAGATSTDTTQVASTVATSQAQTTSEASTVAQTVTAPVTIVNNTTDAVTNASATTDAVTTASATTDVVTTASVTTDAVTTPSATTAATTTVGPTTTGPTTVSPSTAVPTYTTATTEPPTSQSVNTVTSSPFIGSTVSETTQTRANATTTGTLITSAPATILGLEPWLFGLIIGAALFLIIAIGMLVYCLVKRKKRKAARIAERSSPWIHTERTDDIRLQRINKSDDPWRKSDSVEDKKTMYGVNNTTVNVFDNDNQAFDSSPILRLATRTKDRNSSERDTSSINSSTPSRTTSPKPKALTKVSVPVIGEKSTSASDAKEKDDKEENEEEEEGDDSSVFSLKSDEPGLSASMNSFKSPTSTPSTSPRHKIESSSAAPSSGKATPDSRPKKGVAATTPVVPGSTSPLKPNDQSNSSIPPPPVSGGIPPPPSVPTSIPAPPTDEKSPMILPPPPPPPPPDANGQVRDATGAIVNNDEINDRQSSFLHNK